MLLRFTLENFKSFRSQSDLNLVASPKVNEFNNRMNTIGDIQVLKSTVILGENGSGKSNLIEAISLLKNLVLNGYAHIETYQKNKDVSLLNASFYVDNALYEYTIILKNHEHNIFIEHEYLRKSLSGKKEPIFHLLFDRQYNHETNEYEFEIGRNLKHDTKSNLMRNTDTYELFLHKYKNEFNDFKNIHNWLDNLVILDENTFPLSDVIDLLNGPNKQTILDLINGFGLRIDEIHIDNYQVELQYHNNVRIDLFDESKGVRKIVAIAAILFDAIINKKVIIIDELQVHTNIIHNIIRLINKHEMQLVLVTQDASVLDKFLLSSDQVYLVEHDNIFSLHEFKNVEVFQSWQQCYLQGRFGGLPFINIPEIEL